MAANASPIVVFDMIAVSGESVEMGTAGVPTSREVLGHSNDAKITNAYPDSILDQCQSTTLSNAANASCVPEDQLFIRG